MMIRLSGDNDEVREQAVFIAWRTAAGTSLARSCVPFRLYQKQLVIAVQDQTWKKQMESVSGEFLFRLNSILQAPLVTFIEFRIDPYFVLAARKDEALRDEKNEPQADWSVSLPEAENIKDEVLRAQFLRAAGKYLARTQKS